MAQASGPQASATDLKKLFDTQQGYVRALPTRLPRQSFRPRSCHQFTSTSVARRCRRRPPLLLRHYHRRHHRRYNRRHPHRHLLRCRRRHRRRRSLIHPPALSWTASPRHHPLRAPLDPHPSDRASPLTLIARVDVSRRFINYFFDQLDYEPLQQFCQVRPRAPLETAHSTNRNRLGCAKLRLSFRTMTHLVARYHSDIESRHVSALDQTRHSSTYAAAGDSLHYASILASAAGIPAHSIPSQQIPQL